MKYQIIETNALVLIQWDGVDSYSIFYDMIDFDNDKPPVAAGISLEMADDELAQMGCYRV